ncbi:hypothetical protein ACFU5M_28675, partial [Nocardia sp. NPDC057455]
PATRPQPTEERPARPASAPAMGTPSARRRRRAESDDETPQRRLSVAEIMANLQSEERERR